MEEAVRSGQLQVEAGKNIREMVSSYKIHSGVDASIRELVEGKQWGELNDRFFRTLERVDCVGERLGRW